MKTILLCILLFLVGVLQLQAYEPPKGITWDMTINDVDSILGIKFKPIKSESEFILDYHAIDRWNDLTGPIEEKIRKVIKITIPDYDKAEIINLHVQCNKETNKVIRFSIEFNPYGDAPPYIRRAMVSKYGRPDDGNNLSALWEDDDGSWIAFIAKPYKPDFIYYLDYIRIAYGSPDYNYLVEKEMTVELQKRAKEQKNKEAERKKAAMESDF